MTPTPDVERIKQRLDLLKRIPVDPGPSWYAEDVPALLALVDEARRDGWAKGRSYGQAVVESALAEVTAQRDELAAENERLRAEVTEDDEMFERWDRRWKSIDAQAHNCACEYDNDSDACMAHYPAKQALEAKLAQAVEALEAIEAWCRPWKGASRAVIRSAVRLSGERARAVLASMQRCDPDGSRSAVRGE
jgi:hypothetical protein